MENAPPLWSPETFVEILEELRAEIPPVFFQGLSGGVWLAEEARTNPDAPALSILGEYRVHPQLGRSIVIYYGSFVQAHAGADRDRLTVLLRGVLRHELLHHVESLASCHDLALEDLARLRAYRDPL